MSDAPQDGETPSILEGMAADQATAPQLLDQRLPGLGPGEFAEGSLLHQRFVQPTFSVLDARQGSWQSRKQAWLRKGIQSEVGREHVVTYTATFAAEKYGRNMDAMRGASIFDPVLCELAYRWWCPYRGAVLDPFAGGSVRGLVAGYLGNTYTGIDLSARQVDSNNDQLVGMEIDDDDPAAEGLGDRVRWVHGDSCEVLQAQHEDVEPGGYDFVFTCPPYGDLEVYSDDPRDLSRMDWNGFTDAYYAIAHEAVRLLADHRFLVYVVADYRSKDGIVKPLVAETIGAFAAAGASLYNVATLVTPVGTMQLRAQKQWRVSRKLVSGHQAVLCFVKGDPRKATEHLETNPYPLPQAWVEGQETGAGAGSPTEPGGLLDQQQATAEELEAASDGQNRVAQAQHSPAPAPPGAPAHSYHKGCCDQPKDVHVL